MMAYETQPLEVEKELTAAFKVFDHDGSGTISAEELANVLKALGEDLTSEQIDEMIREADRDNDGAIDCRFAPTRRRDKSLSSS